MDTHKMIAQSILKAAGKTFLQTFIISVAPLLLAWVGNAQLALQNTQNGGNVDIDFDPLYSILVSGALAAGAALISLVWNMAKGPTMQPPVVIKEPVVVD